MNMNKTKDLISARIRELEERMDAVEVSLQHLAVADAPPEHLTAHLFCWEHQLPDDALTLVRLIRVAGRFSHEMGVPIGYQNEPDLAGEGLTFRRDVLQRAAEELELIPSTVN